MKKWNAAKKDIVVCFERKIKISDRANTKQTSKVFFTIFNSNMYIDQDSDHVDTQRFFSNIIYKARPYMFEIYGKITHTGVLLGTLT